MAPPTWEFDETGHAGAEHLDPRYIAGYDRKAGTDPSDDVEVLRAAGIAERSVVIDLGAGTGTYSPAVRGFMSDLFAPT